MGSSGPRRGPSTSAVFSLLDRPTSRRSLAIVVPRLRTSRVNPSKLATSFSIKA
jgi:hypothetical protein